MNKKVKDLTKIFAAVFIDGQFTFYVDTENTGKNRDGLSWDRPFKSLSDIEDSFIINAIKKYYNIKIRCSGVDFIKDTINLVDFKYSLEIVGANLHRQTKGLLLNIDSENVTLKGCFFNAVY